MEDPSNTYALPGTYSLTLSVTDSYGCTDDTILVDYITVGGPSGDPSWFQTAGECAQGANFVMNDPIDIASISWSLGDGNLMMDTLSFSIITPNQTLTSLRLPLWMP